jgi:hypothetical protein
VRGWLERERPRRLVAATPRPGSRWTTDRDYQRYNAWQAEALRLALREGRWRGAGRRVFPELGLRVAGWQPEAGPARPGGRRGGRRAR